MQAFRAWRSEAASEHLPDAWREFDTIIQDLRLQAMTHGVSGQEAIDEAVCHQIDGHTFNEVLEAGYANKLEDLEKQRDEMKAMVDANALLVARPGDDDSASELDRRRVEQQKRLGLLLAEIDRTKRRLAELRGTTMEAKPATATTPTALSRDDALREIYSMFEQRLGTATLRDGEWPVQVDRSGRQLVGDDLAEFLTKKQAALENHNVVIPVRVRDGWWIFSAQVERPTFSSAVTANLTPEDLHRIAERWENSEAINWARKQALDEPPEEAIAKREMRLKATMTPAK